MHCGIPEEHYFPATMFAGGNYLHVDAGTTLVLALFVSISSLLCSKCTSTH